MHLCLAITICIFLSLSASRAHLLRLHPSVRPSVYHFPYLYISVCLSVIPSRYPHIICVSVRLFTSLCVAGWLTASLHM